MTSSPHPDRVCAVVVAFNRAELLRRCLASLFAQTHPPAHVLVVDNASTDATPDVLAQFPVETLRMAENTGAAGGFEAGVRHAAGQGWDWLWIVDDDIEATPPALEKLLDAAAPDVAALGSVKIGPDGRVQHLCAGTYSIGRMRLTPARPPGDAPLDVGFLSFAGLLVRGSVARRETPRGDLFAGHDDTEYVQRLRRWGRLVLVPGSVLVHHNSQAATTRRVLGRTVAVGGRWRIYYNVRNPLLIARAYGTRAQRVQSIFVGAGRLVLRLGAALVHHRGDGQRWWLAARGYVDGLRGRAGRVVDPTDYR